MPIGSCLRRSFSNLSFSSSSFATTSRWLTTWVSSERCALSRRASKASISAMTGRPGWSCRLASLSAWTTSALCPVVSSVPENSRTSIEGKLAVSSEHEDGILDTSQLESSSAVTAAFFGEPAVARSVTALSNSPRALVKSCQSASCLPSAKRCCWAFWTHGAKRCTLVQLRRALSSAAATTRMVTSNWTDVATFETLSQILTSTSRTCPTHKLREDLPIILVENKQSEQRAKIGSVPWLCSTSQTGWRGLQHCGSSCLSNYTTTVWSGTHGEYWAMAETNREFENDTVWTKKAIESRKGLVWQTSPKPFTPRSVNAATGNFVATFYFHGDNCKKRTICFALPFFPFSVFFFLKTKSHEHDAMYY